MASLEDQSRATEALISAIWGPRPDVAIEISPEERETQNWLVARAIEAYLQAYIDEAES